MMLSSKDDDDDDDVDEGTSNEDDKGRNGNAESPSIERYACARLSICCCCLDCPFTTNDQNCVKSLARRFS